MKRTHLDLEREKIGESVLGAPVFWIPSRDKCRLLVVSGIHGEEPETTVSLSRALRCIDRDSIHPGIGLVLCANPDGIAMGARGNANGVDLNRNFPAKDWQPEPTTCRWHHDEDEYLPIKTGDAPGSEPETKIIIGLVERTEPDMILALHGPLACIDDPLRTDAAKWLAEKSGLPLEDVDYPTPGSMGTWAAEKEIPIVTWEFPPDGIESLSRTQVPVLVEILQGKSEFAWGF